MDAVENKLIAISQIPANSGHSLHKGTPREAFIKEFLNDHLPETVAIGTGEIIDANSKPNESRNQFDIIVYQKNYPKLNFGGNINGFLIESVIATIEVKSTITKVDLKNAIDAAKKCKNLKKNITKSFSTGYIPPSVLNYVVAYEGPVHLKTITDWITEIHNEEVNDVNNLTDQRLKISAPSIDGIFVLKKGFVYFDNVPIGFITDEMRKNFPEKKWVYADTDSGNLLLFFMFLQQATANIQGQWLNPLPYLQSFKLSQNVNFI